MKERVTMILIFSIWTVTVLIGDWIWIHSALYSQRYQDSRFKKHLSMKYQSVWGHVIDKPIFLDGIKMLYVELQINFQKLFQN